MVPRRESSWALTRDGANAREAAAAAVRMASIVCVCVCVCLSSVKRVLLCLFFQWAGRGESYVRCKRVSPMIPRPAWMPVCCDGVRQEQSGVEGCSGAQTRIHLQSIHPSIMHA